MTIPAALVDLLAIYNSMQDDPLTPAHIRNRVCDEFMAAMLKEYQRVVR